MGGAIHSLDIAYGNKKLRFPDFTPKKMKVNVNYVNKLLGLQLSEIDIKKLLERMGFGYINGYALVPSYRADILHQIDLVEDIAIAYGYENFKAKIPNVATIGQEDKFEIFKNKVADSITGLGFLETSTYNLSNKEFQSKRMEVQSDTIELLNSISSDYNVLRSWVLPSLMEILGNNKHHEYPQRIFTIGTVFKKNNKEETGIQEDQRLAIAIASEKTDYTKARQVLDYLLRSLDLKYEINEAEHGSFIPGRVGRAVVKGKKVAYIGEISPKVIRNWDLNVPVTAFELNLSELFEVLEK
jgi:phenylalanyl-tRNA synthetase beta chain